MDVPTVYSGYMCTMGCTQAKENKMDGFLKVQAHFKRWGVTAVSVRDNGEVFVESGAPYEGDRGGIWIKGNQVTLLWDPDMDNVTPKDLAEEGLEPGEGHNVSFAVKPGTEVIQMI